MEDFDRIWQDLTTWGRVTIVHTADGVFETACTIPRARAHAAVSIFTEIARSVGT